MAKVKELLKRLKRVLDPTDPENPVHKWMLKRKMTRRDERLRPEDVFPDFKPKKKVPVPMPEAQPQSPDRRERLKKMMKKRRSA